MKSRSIGGIEGGTTAGEAPALAETGGAGGTAATTWLDGAAVGAGGVEAFAVAYPGPAEATAPAAAGGEIVGTAGAA